MDLGLRDKVAVVAASSAGIGRAVAEVFAQEGARVVVNGRREDVLRRTADQIADRTGAEIEAVVGDLTRAEDCVRVIERAVERFGAVDALFTNGGGPPSKDFDSLSDDDWQAAFELVLLSAIRLVRAALPHLRQTRGSIVNLSSISVKQPVAGLILSNSLRPAVIGLAKTLADELAGSGIRVNDVGSGHIWTDRQEYLSRERAKKHGTTVDEEVTRVQSHIPLGRYGTPEEFANLVVFLSSPRAAYITGQLVLVDGGLYRGLM